MCQETTENKKITDISPALALLLRQLFLRPPGTVGKFSKQQLMFGNIGLAVARSSAATLVRSSFFIFLSSAGSSGLECEVHRIRVLFQLSLTLPKPSR